jgi:hypothetical protein
MATVGQDRGWEGAALEERGDEENCVVEEDQRGNSGIERRR